jgi:four helix bundle protein
MHNFKELSVWQKAIQLAGKIYKFSSELPPKDQYIFSSQLVRCAISIPSNIAEGAGKESDKDFCRFLGIANGSSFELETQLIILKNIFVNKENEITSLIKDVTTIQKMIFGLAKKHKS